MAASRRARWAWPPAGRPPRPPRQSTDSRRARPTPLRFDAARQTLRSRLQNRPPRLHACPLALRCLLKRHSGIST
eukprot:310104-Pleurochrysis_carterae.AAC.3